MNPLLLIFVPASPRHRVPASSRFRVPASARLRVAASLLFLLLPTLASATWFDPAWKFRRQIDVKWDADKGHDGELATAEFYTDGHCLADGADIRVATDEGRLVASHVLMSGPGDHARVVFSLVRHVQKYYVYFGNDKPPALRPDLQDVKYQSGLLLESREFPGGVAIDSSERIRSAFEKNPHVLGGQMITTPFLGTNPFGPQDRTISKVSGQLSAPVDGDYTFAVAARDLAALLIDGKEAVFAQHGPADARFNKKLTLTRGPHEFVLYQACVGGGGWFTVAWIPPGAKAYAVIPGDAFGSVSLGTVGPLEEIRKEMTADFAVHYEGEAFTADHYSHRYKFAPSGPLKNPRLQLHWDFGDGQTATAPEVEHVYMIDGIYPVTLTMRIGVNSDSQTIKLSVSRDWLRIANPPTDEPPRHSTIVQRYDLAKMPPEWLPWATLLHQRAGNLNAMFAAATQLASLTHHSDVPIALFALADATQEAEKNARAAEMVAVFEHMPPGSDLQPAATMQFARLLMWRMGNFSRAVQILQPLAERGDNDLKRMYGQSLVLSGKADEGKKVLAQIPPPGNSARQSAISGAQARTIEFYLTQKEPEAGEKAWERWQQLFPLDFLEGYSVLLQSRLMEQQNAPLAAAKLAEAFANAVPGSSYAPQLLDRASKLVSASDADKSAMLHKLLKDRYPEDPLSQN